MTEFGAFGCESVYKMRGNSHFPWKYGQEYINQHCRGPESSEEALPDAMKKTLLQSSVSGVKELHALKTDDDRERAKGGKALTCFLLAAAADFSLASFKSI